MVELLRLIRNEDAPPPTNYAALQWWYPKVPHGLNDLVGLRYLVLVGPPSPTALYSDGGFRIHELPTALPRPFFAKRGELANDKQQRLELLAKPTFDPRAVVYLESQDPLPVDALPADGTARIALDLPERIVIELDVRASGWLVLSDRWTDGWKARIDGAEQPVLCADHAFRAVHVAPGMRELEFRYEPPSWRLGWLAACLGAFVALGWFLVAGGAARGALAPVLDRASRAQLSRPGC
jgi:hypothetical protein